MSDIIVKLIIYGVIVAAVGAGIGYIHHRIYSEGAASTCTKVTPDADCITQPELQQLIAARDEARTAERAREGELTGLRAATDRQNAANVALAKLGQGIKADNDAFLRQLAAKQNSETRGKIEEWQKLATGVDPEKGDCNAQLKSAGDILRDVLRRVRQ